MAKKPVGIAEDANEALVERGLRALPVRRAPAALEARVLAEIARRAALPWWRRAVSEWPRAPRIALIAACIACVPLAWRACAWIGVRALAFAHRSGAPIDVLRDLAHAAVAAQSSLRLFDGGLPPAWVVGALALASILYATLLGLGAFAYRTLYLNP